MKSASLSESGISTGDSPRISKEKIQARGRKQKIREKFELMGLWVF